MALGAPPLAPEPVRVVVTDDPPYRWFRGVPASERYVPSEAGREGSQGRARTALSMNRC